MCRGEYRGTVVAVKRGLQGGVAQLPQFMEPKQEEQGYRPTDASVHMRTANSTGAGAETITISALSFSKTVSSSGLSPMTEARNPRCSGDMLEMARTASGEMSGTGTRGSFQALRAAVRRLTPVRRKSIEADALAAARDLEAGELASPMSTKVRRMHYGAQLRFRKVFGSGSPTRRNSAEDAIPAVSAGG